MLVRISLFDSTAECMAQSPVSRDGRALAYGATDSARRELNLVSPVEVDRVHVRLFEGAHHSLRDRISTFGGDLVISYQLYDILRRFNIDSAIHFIPAELLSSTGETVEQYLYGYATAEWDILDYDRASHTSVRGTSGGSVVLHVERWVARTDRIPTFDLFCSAPVARWVVSERLREAIAGQRASGCQFVPIDVTGSDHSADTPDPVL